MSAEDPIDFSKDDELVPVVFGRDDDEAEEYRQLLEDHEIEATVGYDNLSDRDEAEAENGRPMSRGIPVLVPETLLDEASEIIADRDDTEDFELEDDFDEDEEEEDEFTLELDEGEIEGAEVSFIDEEEDDLDEDLDEDFFDDDEEEFLDDEDEYDL